MKGAEAIVYEYELFGNKMVKKERIPKKYRPKELDIFIRKTRTKNEARLLHKAKKLDIKTPVVYGIFDYEIIFTYINGNEPTMSKEDVKEAAKILAKLHNGNLIHGDFTKKNLIKNRKGLWVIDFGLGKVSNKIEDKAVDLYTFLKSIKYKKIAISVYKENAENSKFILKRYKEIKKRVRYAS